MKVYGEARMRRPNAILQMRIEVALIPEYVRRIWQRRAMNQCERCIEALTEIEREGSAA